MARPKQLTEQAIKQIWNSFGAEGQDMSFAQFRKQLLDLCDPQKAMQDLDDMVLRQTRERLNRMRIKKVLS
jgi:hypothetical protein